VFGHIHGAYGVAKVDQTVFVNAAIAGRNNRPMKEPHILDLQHVKQ
jgi:Icc-related predicted phosphoesterase